MSEQTNLISIGWYKGEMDFSVSGLVTDLSPEQMKELYSMICVAIGVATNMWKENSSDKAGTIKDSSK